MRWAIRVGAFVIVAVGLAICWSLYQGVSASLHAERGLHASLLTVQLLEDYVVRHDGEWPHSWTDLEGLPPRQWAWYEWPKDSREVQRFVAVDFSADPRRLAMEGIEEFDAVRPIGPFYPFKDYGSVESLLGSLRERIGRGK
jgi:hypothetical protein